MKKIKLNQLYDILDYYYESEKQRICPVLIQIKNKKLIRMENEEKKNQHDASAEIDEKADSPPVFLLQIWRKKDGVMLYERKLANAPKGWGLY